MSLASAVAGGALETDSGLLLRQGRSDALAGRRRRGILQFEQSLQFGGVDRLGAEDQVLDWIG